MVSAMGDTTDELLELAHQICPEPPRRELDMLLTAGERITMSLLSMAIQDMGFEAISFTGSQSGIVTNDQHSGARIIEVRPFRIQDELDRGRVVIVAGYQGVSYKKEITTLGRGGSDTTAVALAAALDAEACEIYSDVDGVYDGDPSVIEDARRLDEISYDEMQELARAGARVLNPQAVEFARRKGIAVYARATRGGGETVVRKDREGIDDQRLTGVACVKDALWLRGGRSRDAGSRLLPRLQGLGAEPVLTALSEEGVNLLLFPSESPGLEPELNKLADREGLTRSTVAAISAVGPGLGGDVGTVHACRNAVVRASGAPPFAVFTDPLRITFLVAPEAADAVQIEVHGVFKDLVPEGLPLEAT